MKCRKELVLSGYSTPCAAALIGGERKLVATWQKGMHPQPSTCSDYASLALIFHIFLPGGRL